MSAVAPSRATEDAGPLRRLYLVRFGFAIVWAGLVAVTATHLGVAAVVLVVLYPLYDVAATVVDARRSRARELTVNVVISSLAALGLIVAASSDIPAVLRVWGAWAILAGVVQLLLALRRRRELGGQLAQILSGGISVLAGVSFVAMAARPDPSLTLLAGYAALGGIFFLVSALGLGRRPRAGTSA